MTQDLPVEPRVTVVNVPVETISEERIIELAEAALGEYPEPVTVEFREILDEDAPYTSGIFRRATRTIEVRSTLTEKGIQYTLVHEIAHALTEGAHPNPHGEPWCETHVELMNELLPEYAEQQARFVHKVYECETH